jgi:hypothetical protein
MQDKIKQSLPWLIFRLNQPLGYVATSKSQSSWLHWPLQTLKSHWCPTTHLSQRSLIQPDSTWLMNTCSCFKSNTLLLTQMRKPHLFSPLQDFSSHYHLPHKSNARFLFNFFRYFFPCKWILLPILLSLHRDTLAICDFRTPLQLKFATIGILLA